MGLEILKDQFTEEDYRQFAIRLQENLQALKRILARPGFGEGPLSLGAEIELSLVNEDGHPLPVNREVLAKSMEPRLTLELDRFNLELNLDPVPLARKPFETLFSQANEALMETGRGAGALGGDLSLIGILPTLEDTDLQSSAMTNLPRPASGLSLREPKG
jgi:hypothetical protein